MKAFFPDRRVVPVVLALLLAIPCRAETETPAAAKSPPAAEDLGDGRFRIGLVELDKTKRTVSFPANVNMLEGLLEYLIVGVRGKTHESLLVTRAQPVHIHAAMLMLGAKPDAKETASATPPDQITEEYLKKAPVLQGKPVSIEVEWSNGGKKVRHRVEELVFNRAKSKTMSLGPWTYNGSMFYEGKFLAQLESSVASVVVDPVALINNPRSGREMQEIWDPHKDALPKLGKDVVVRVTLLKEPTGKESEK
jgi:hypothetical protein